MGSTANGIDLGDNTVAGAILVGMGGISLAIRWSVGRMAKAQDRAISALVDSTKSHATLASKFDALMSKFELLTTRFDRIVDTLIRDPRLDESQRARLAAASTGAPPPTPPRRSSRATRPEVRSAGSAPGLAIPESDE